MASRRALHFVFKIGNRTETAKFYRDVLGMKFLRHEEFEKGCDAACNGPYDGKWSKSMVGFGPEDNHFVVELTYNYGIGTYQMGNDFKGITIQSPNILANAKQNGYTVTQEGDKNVLTSPDGYQFIIENKESNGDPVKKVTLASSDLKKSVDYWSNLCGMKIFSQDNKSAVLGYDDNQCKLELVDIGTEVEHAKAFGRIAFSCPRAQLPELQEKMKSANQTILTPLISLDTPGKATVEVVILADPDGHEICFVGDEAFRELSQVDPQADTLLDQAIAADKSEEWFKKKGISKAAA
ncbi:glyoxalase domain-containing protein 4-like [Crassostrea virginica]